MLLRVAFSVLAGAIGLEVLMDLLVHHASDGGMIHFAAYMIAFLGVRKIRHAMEVWGLRPQPMGGKAAYPRGAIVAPPNRG